MGGIDIAECSVADSTLIILKSNSLDDFRIQQDFTEIGEISKWITENKWLCDFSKIKECWISGLPHCWIQTEPHWQILYRYKMLGNVIEIIVLLDAIFFNLGLTKFCRLDYYLFFLKNCKTFLFPSMTQKISWNVVTKVIF